ncbi:MAG: XdhC family protein [Candidatus Heimdallarchaeota archaeon]
MKNDFAQALFDFTKQYDLLWVVTVVHTEGSSPRKTGAKMIVDGKGNLLWGTIGGGTIEKIATKRITKLKDPTLQMYNVGADGPDTVEEIDSTGMLCGGIMTLYYEPHGNVNFPQIWIFGAGHIGHALYELLIKQEWNIILLDNRPEVLTEEKFPKAERRIGSYKELAKQVDFAKEDYFLIMTAGHKWDAIILKECVRKPWKYLGVIGSDRKVEQFFGELRAEGVPEAAIQKINAPIGYGFGESPEEIAVDIAAKLLEVRYRKQ